MVRIALGSNDVLGGAHRADHWRRLWICLPAGGLLHEFGLSRRRDGTEYDQGQGLRSGHRAADDRRPAGLCSRLVEPNLSGPLSGWRGDRRPALWCVDAMGGRMRRGRLVQSGFRKRRCSGGRLGHGDRRHRARAGSLGGLSDRGAVGRSPSWPQRGRALGMGSRCWGLDDRGPLACRSWPRR